MRVALSPRADEANWSSVQVVSVQTLGTEGGGELVTWMLGGMNKREVKRRKDNRTLLRSTALDRTVIASVTHGRTGADG